MRDSEDTGNLAAASVAESEFQQARARATAAAWLERGAIERHGRSDHQTVLGHGDPNLANFLWDAGQIRLHV